MNLNVKDVFVGAPDQAVTGAISRTDDWTGDAPATLSDFDTIAADAGGFVTEDGVNITPTESTESLKDWSLKNIRKLLTDFDATVSWQHMSLDRVSAENFFGTDNVEYTPSNGTHGNQMRMGLSGEIRPRYAWIFRIKDGPRRVIVFVPHGEIGERGEIPLNASSAITLPVTLNTFPDKNGFNLYIYTDDGVVGVSDMSEKWELEVAGAPTGGTYLLNVNGAPSAPIAFDASAANIATALNAITGVAGATVTGTATKTITFTTPMALTADGSALTGGTNPNVAVTATS